MPIEDFEGYHSRCLKMPDGGKIICFFYRNNTKRPSFDDSNRNVFRLDKNGNVIWQVTRIDHPERNPAAAYQRARQRGEPGCIESFIEFSLRKPDGTTNIEGLMPQDVMDWIPGCTVELVALGIGTLWYSLDTETGVAREITKSGIRPW